MEGNWIFLHTVQIFHCVLSVSAYFMTKSLMSSIWYHAVSLSNRLQPYHTDKLWLFSVICIC